MLIPLSIWRNVAALRAGESPARAIAALCITTLAAVAALWRWTSGC